MEKLKAFKRAAIFRNIARYTVLALGILVFLYALVSGSEEYGGGINGIIKNSPNALPWLLLMILVYVAWKWEVVGGTTLIILGLSILYVINFPSTNFLSLASILAILIIILGIFFILSWYLESD